MTRAIAVALFALAGMTTAATAESPVAIVEEVQGKVTGAELMDYLSPRAVIKLGQDAAITLSYLNSCRRETITGIGTAASRGFVRSRQLFCRNLSLPAASLRIVIVARGV